MSKTLTVAAIAFALTGGAANAADRWTFDRSASALMLPGDHMYISSVQAGDGASAFFACTSRDPAISFGATSDAAMSFTGERKSVKWLVDGKGPSQKAWDTNMGSVHASASVSRQIFDALLTAEQSLAIKFDGTTANFGVSGAASALKQISAACGQ